MRDHRVEESSKDGWVSFTDILLSTVCAVLFIQAWVANQSSRDEHESAGIEERLLAMEKSTAEIDKTAKSASVLLRELSGVAKLTPLSDASPVQKNRDTQELRHE